MVFQKVFVSWICIFALLSCKKIFNTSETVQTESLDEDDSMEMHGYKPYMGPKTKVTGFDCDAAGNLVAKRVDGKIERLLQSPRAAGWDQGELGDRATCNQKIYEMELSHLTSGRPFSVGVSFWGRRPVLCLFALTKYYLKECSKDAGTQSIWARIPMDRDDWLKPSKISDLATSVIELPSSLQMPSSPVVAPVAPANVAAPRESKPLSQPQTHGQDGPSPYQLVENSQNFSQTASEYSDVNPTTCGENKDSFCREAEKLMRTLLHPDQKEKSKNSNPKEGKARIVFLGSGLTVSNIWLVFDYLSYEPVAKR